MNEQEWAVHISRAVEKMDLPAGLQVLVVVARVEHDELHTGWVSSVPEDVAKYVFRELGDS